MNIHRGFRMFLAGLFLLMPFAAPSLASARQPFPDSPGGDIPLPDAGDSVSATSGVVPLILSQASSGDSDGDTLLDTLERSLGIDPGNPDSDCDYIDDASEVGSNPAAPVDTDGDGRINALENAFIDSDNDGTKDQADASGGTQFSCWYFKPFAVINDGTDSSTVEVRVSGSSITAVSITGANYANYLKIDSQVVTNATEIQLYDDATHGDRVAGDHVWARGNFTGYNGASLTSTLLIKFATIKVTAGGVTTAYPVSSLYSGMITALEVGVVSSTQVKPVTSDAERGLQVTDHFANIVNPLAALTVKQYSGTNTQMRVATKLFYRYFPDDFDFIFLIVQNPALGGFPAAYSSSAKNDTQHIGKSIFNSTASFGSAGRLQNALMMNFATSGPTLHEIMHRWAVSGQAWKDMGFSQCYSDSSHWGYSGGGLGQLGGFDPATFKKESDQAGYQVYSVGVFFPNVNIVETYSPLEQYLAGFRAAADVPNVIIPTNIDCASIEWDSANNKILFHATGYTSYTMAQIAQNLGGERIPNFASAQKNYRAAFAMISDHKLTPAEMAMFEFWSSSFGAATQMDGMKNFKLASGGVATVDTTIQMPAAWEKRYLPAIMR